MFWVVGCGCRREFQRTGFNGEGVRWSAGGGQTSDRTERPEMRRFDFPRRFVLRFHRPRKTRPRDRLEPGGGDAFSGFLAHSVRASPEALERCVNLL